MKHTKENIIKLLEALMENNLNLAKYYEDGDEKYHERLEGEANGLHQAIMLLEDKKFFDNICKIMMVK